MEAISNNQSLIMSVDLGSAHGKITIGASDALRSISSVKGGLLGLASPFGIAKVAALGLGAGLVGVGVAAGGLVAGIASSVKVASSLEEQLSGVKAVMGASGDEMVQLKDLIMDLGVDPNLKVSALEAAQTVEMLARNGAKADDILNGMARSTILLSNATGGDFAQSADIATDVMAIWKIEAEDVGRAVDGITNVVNNSKFAIEDYAGALAAGGGVAGSMGVSLEEFNTVIAGIAPMFASGADAGTAFKVFLQRLVPQSDEAAGMMKRLGINFFDASGNMKDMGEIAEILREKLFDEFRMAVELGGATKEMVKAAEKANKEIPGLTTKIAEQESQMAILQRELDGVIEKYGEGSIQADKKRLAIQKLTNNLDENRAKLNQHQVALGAMTDATVETISTTTKLTEKQRSNAISTMFGTRGMRTAAAIAAMGADGYNELYAAITQAGTAQENASTRMDNLAGALKILDGIIETIKIGIGDEFIPVVRQGVESLTGFLAENKDVIVDFFGGIAGGVSTALDKFQLLVTVIQGLWKGDPFALEVAGQQFGEFGMFVARSVDSVKGMVEDIKNGDYAGAFSTFAGILGDAWNTLIWPKIQEWGSDFWKWITGEGGAIESSGENLDSLVTAINTLLEEKWPLISVKLQEWSDRFWGWLLGDEGQPGAIAKASEALGELVTEIQTWVESDEGQGKLRKLGQNLGDFLVDGIKLVLENQEKIDEVMGALGEALIASVPALLESLHGVGKAIASGIIESIASNFTGDEVAKAIGSIGGETAGSVGASFVPGGPIIQKIFGWQSGGVVPGPIGKPTLGIIHGGEGIIPAGDMAALASGASGGASYSSSKSTVIEGDIIINLPNVREPLDAARAVRAELENIINQAYVTD